MLWTNGGGKNPKDDPSQKTLPDGAAEPQKSSAEAPVEKLAGRSSQGDHDTSLGYFVEGHAPDSTDTKLRYAAYTNRIRTILGSAHRYVAYTSEIGESFRPIARVNLVRAAYGVSWMYVLGDVGYEGYRARLRGDELACDPAKRLLEPDFGLLDDYRVIMGQRMVFQTFASMALPAFTIHAIVKYSGRAMKDVGSKSVRTWGPVGLGLAVVPFLPRMFDEPVEKAVEWAAHEVVARVERGVKGV